MQRRGLLLPVFCGLSVCLLYTTMSCAKMHEPIDMLFGLWTQGTMYYVGARIRQGEGHFSRGTPHYAAFRKNSLTTWYGMVW